MCAYQPKYQVGEWVSIAHPQVEVKRASISDMKGLKGKRAWPTKDISLKDFKMWDHAFLTRHGMGKEEAQKNLVPFTKEEVFIVLRNTTRKHGKRRVKVLNPYTGKSKAIFVEQVKCRLDIELEPTNINRWVLLDKWQNHKAIASLGTPEDPLQVTVLDAEDTFFNDLKDSDLTFKPASYFGASTIMCPREVGPPQDSKNQKAESDDKTKALLNSLMKSLGMNELGDGLRCYPEEMTLVIGAPHMNKNLTKSYKTRPSLGCVLKIRTGRFLYDTDSLYNKQAPDSYDTKSAEGDKCEYFYVPFYQVGHSFSFEVPTDSGNVIFGNYPEYGAAHLLAAL
jgi:hypothetical protein